MAAFSTQQLYGGAITADLPSDYIDASDLRQVPHHQEVYLSPTQLTSIIFEINEYAGPLVGASASASASTENADIRAALLNFEDVITPPDRLQGPPSTPKAVSLARDSFNGFPAYMVHGIIISPEIERVPSALPVEWQQSPQTKDHLVKAWLLLVRLPQYRSDLCVRVNLPLKELSAEQAVAEEGRVSEILHRIVATLDIRDFALFGESD